MDNELFDFPQLGMNDDETWPPFPSESAAADRVNEHFAPPLDIPFSDEWADFMPFESPESRMNGVSAEKIKTRKMSDEKKELENEMLDDSGLVDMDEEEDEDFLLAAIEDPRYYNTLVDESLVLKAPVEDLQPIQATQQIANSLDSRLPDSAMMSSGSSPPPTKMAKLSNQSIMNWSLDMLDDEDEESEVTEHIAPPVDFPMRTGYPDETSRNSSSLEKSRKRRMSIEGPDGSKMLRFDEEKAILHSDEIEDIGRRMNLVEKISEDNLHYEDGSVEGASSNSTQIDCSPTPSNPNTSSSSLNGPSSSIRQISMSLESEQSEARTVEEIFNKFFETPMKTGGRGGQGSSKNEARPSSSSSLPRLAVVQPRENCPVCGAISACSAYGATTCQACRKFFFRCVEKTTTELICVAVGNCEINEKSRKNCMLCRFKKCIAVGMKKTKQGTARLTEEEMKKNSTAQHLEAVFQWVSEFAPFTDLDPTHQRHIIETSWPFLLGISIFESPEEFLLQEHMKNWKREVQKLEKPTRDELDGLKGAVLFMNAEVSTPYNFAEQREVCADLLRDSIERNINTTGRFLNFNWFVEVIKTEPGFREEVPDVPQTTIERHIQQFLGI